jgi:hypothetical protein
MARKRKCQWQAGDVFAVPLPDGTRCAGQVLGIRGNYIHVVNCAFFDIRFKPNEGPQRVCDMQKLIAALATTRESLDYCLWEVFGREPVCLPRSSWPNEQYADKNYVGAVTEGSGIVSEFLAAYYGLYPWNGYKDPEYFDKLLLSPQKRPPASQLKFK